MGGINFVWLVVWVPSPDWLCRILEECHVCQALRWSRRTWVRECGPCPDFASNTLEFALHLGKSRKTPVRVTEWRSAVQRRTRFILSTWPSRAMASAGLLSPAALVFRVRRRCQPSVSLSNCRVALLRGSPHQLTLSQSSRSGHWYVIGKKRNAQILVYLPITYVPKGTSSEAKTLGLLHL